MGQMSDIVIGRVTSTTINQPSGVIEVLLEKTAKDRDRYKQALSEIFYSINEWSESMVKEPADDLLAAINHKIDLVLNG